MKLLVHWAISAVAVYFTAWLLDGIVVEDWMNAFWVAALLGLVNTVVRPILMLISLPIILFTFGLFIVVINAVVLLFVDDLVEGFQVEGFWTAVFGSLIISFITMLLRPRDPNKGNPKGGAGPGGPRYEDRGNLRDPFDSDSDPYR